MQVELMVEDLDWVPAVLARLGQQFVIERPVELRDLVRELRRLTESANRR